MLFGLRPVWAATSSNTLLSALPSCRADCAALSSSLSSCCVQPPFAAVSLLSVFVVPIKEAALLFIAFFGYYPILQETFAKIRPKALSWVVRLAIFNAAVVAAYWVIVNVFGITEILEEFGDFGKYSVLVLLAFANVFFVIYDGAVKNITLAYRNWFRPKILKKVR